MASLRTIGVRLRMEVGEFKRGARQAADETDNLKKRLDDAGEKGKADLDQIATGAALLGAALLGVAGAAVVAAAKFDKQMSEVKAVAGATAEEFGQLRQAALDAGAATVFSATEAAQAEAELAKAGIGAADILGGALTGSLSLASAGSLELATAAEIAAAAMNTFNLEGQDVEHIADVLAAAANKSAASVEDLGLGLQQVGLVANQVGFSLEETVGLLAAFADRGLRGSDGATSLKTALQRLAAPTGEAAELMDELGISMFDANGQFVSASDIAGQLETAFKDLAPAQRSAALQTIFGSDAIRAANVFLAEGRTGIQEYIDAVNDQGAAARVAGEKLNNLAGDVEELTGSLETLAIQGGSGANAGLRVLTQTATAAVNAFGALPGPVQSAVVILSGLTGATLLGAAGWLKFRRTLSDALEELGKTGPVGTRAAGALQTTAKWAGRAAAAFVAIEAAGIVIDKFLKEDLNPQLEAASSGLRAFAADGVLAGEAARLFGEDGQQLADAIEAVGRADEGFNLRGFVDQMRSVEAVTDSSTERVAAFDESLAKLVREGHATEAGLLVELMASRSKKSIDELRKLLPQYAGAVEVVTTETKEVAIAQQEAALSAEELIEEWDKLFGRAQSADEQMLNAKEAVDDVTEAFKEGSKALDGNSREALENRIAIRAAAREAQLAALAFLEEGGSAEGAQKMLDAFKDETVKATGATGKAKTQVKLFADELFRLPKQTTVIVTAKVKSTGLAQLERSLREIQRLGGTAAAFRHGAVVEHAQVGLLREAKIFAPRAPAMYAFAEPATRGEAFVPKHGDRSRSLAILDHAAGWHGARVVPEGGGWYGGMSGGGGPIEVIVRPAPGADRGLMRELVQSMRFEVRTKANGSAQTYLGG